jgi:hypothetical protein
MVAGPPCQQSRPGRVVVVLNPYLGDAIMVVPQNKRSLSCTPLNPCLAPTLEGSPSRHILPSPLTRPPPPPPATSPSPYIHHPRFEIQVLLRTPAMDAVEAELATAMVGGSQLEVNSEQVLNQLTRFYQVDEGASAFAITTRVDSWLTSPTQPRWTRFFMPTGCKGWSWCLSSSIGHGKQLRNLIRSATRCYLCWNTFQHTFDWSRRCKRSSAHHASSLS